MLLAVIRKGGRLNTVINVQRHETPFNSLAIEIQSPPTMVCTISKPPNVPKSTFDQPLLSVINSIDHHKHIIIGGDFNINLNDRSLSTKSPLQSLADFTQLIAYRPQKKNYWTIYM